MFDAFEAAEKRARLNLPFRWNIAVHLPTLGRTFKSNDLFWPVGGAPIVEGKYRPFKDFAELAELTPHVVIAEVTTPAELEFLAIGAAARGALVLAITTYDDRFHPLYGHPLELRAPGFVVLPRNGIVLQEAAHYLETLVRERATTLLLEHWRQLLRAYEAAAEAVYSGMMPLEALTARPSFAPLSTIEHIHVAGVVGLWFEPDRKAANELEVQPARLRRKLSSWPPGLAAAVAPLPPLKQARMLLVEDDEGLAATTAKVIERVARGLGRSLDMTVVHSGEAAVEHIEQEGAPELLWADVRLGAGMSGIDLVRWLRRERLASVVFGKSDGGSAETVRTLTSLGAIGVWTGFGLPSLPSGLQAGLQAAAEAQEIREGEVAVTLVEAKLADRLERGLIAGEARARAGEAQERLLALMKDLAEVPAATGNAGTSLEEVRAAAAQRVLKLEGSHAAAAEVLGVDVRTLRNLIPGGADAAEV